MRSGPSKLHAYKGKGDPYESVCEARAGWSVRHTCEMPCSQATSPSYSAGSKLVMPPFTPLTLCSSHHSIILSYARAACSSRSKQPSDVGLPFRLHARGKDESLS